MHATLRAPTHWLLVHKHGEITEDFSGIESTDMLGRKQWMATAAEDVVGVRDGRPYDEQRMCYRSESYTASSE